MIYPGHNRFIRWFFTGYIRFIVERHFSRFSYNPIAVDGNKSVLLLANHYSWWDGFVYYKLNRLLFKKKFHILVLEKTMKRWRFMRHLGAFSVSKGTRSVVQTIDFAAQLLNDPRNLVLIFPQGGLYSNFVDKVVFEKGPERIILQLRQPVQCVLAAGFTESLDQPKPAINIGLKNVMLSGNQAANVAEIYNAHYIETKTRHIQTVIS